MMPARLMSPTVGLTVMTPFWVAGDSSEPEVSVPIAAAASVGERQGAACRILGIPGSNVGLDEDRDALEGPALGRLVAVERCGDRLRVGVELAHRIEAETGAVISLDAREVGAHQRRGSCFA